MPINSQSIGAFIAANKPFATLGELAAQKSEQQTKQLQTYVTQAQLQRLADEHQSQQRAAQRQQVISGLAQKHTHDGVLDQEDFLHELQSTGDLEAVAQVSDSLNKAHNAKLAEEKANREKEKDEADWVSSQIRDATPESWGQRRGYVVSKVPSMAQALPEQFDPQAIEHVTQAALTSKEYYDRIDKLEAQANDKYGKTLVNLALAETPEQQQEALAMAQGLGVSKRLAADGITPEAVASMTPEQRQKLLLRVPGLTPNAILQAMTPKAQQSSSVNAGSFEDYVLRYAREKGKTPEQVTTQEITQLRKTYQQADDRPPTVNVNTGDKSDIVEAVKGMKEGTIPPQLPGRASKEYIAMMAEARRQGFDLAGAATDWVATQKHIASLNGAQQLRLNQAIGQLPELLDSVDALASKWKAGRFPILNKANMAAAKNGVYGRDAASIANQLDAQIADVTADLGAVYMGGNSPTDHALDLSAKALNSNWDEKVLHEMVALARKNVQTRKNSMNSTGVQGASDSNLYSPPQAAPPSSKPPVPSAVNPAALRQRYNY